MPKSKSTTNQTIALFWHHATQYKRLLVPLIILVPATVLLMDFFRPYVLSLVLQKISNHQYDANNLWASFGSDIVAYSLATLASAVVGWRLNVWFIWNLEIRVVRDIAQRIFEHLMILSPGFHTNRFAGSLVSQANKLTGAYVRFVDATVFNLYPLLIGMGATVVILAPKVPIYAISMVTLALVFIAGTYVFSKPVREANTLEAEAQSRQTGNLADSISNVMAIKSFANSEHENKRYLKSANETLNAGYKSVRTTTIRETYSSLITSAINISAILIAVLGTKAFNINIGTLFLIVSYTGQIGSNLWEFQNVLRQYNRAIGDSSDMIKILAIEPEIKDSENPEEVRIKDGQIDINNLSFTHDENSDTLFKDLSIHISAGQKIGLVGRSGSGKTTLTKLLLRFSDIDEGEILIDGQNIRSIKQDDLRKNIAYVPQEPLLFHRSLLENIAYGKGSASQEEIVKAAKLAHAHDFIEKLPKGYETLVGERGVKLSGGQRQRVAIARAMLKDAPILVLDEATSALDSESEKLIQDALWKLMEGRTAIVIAHRLSTIQKMDRIIVLEEGKIVEQGSHVDLLAKNGTYAKLWAHQSGGFLED